jgi:hypothetical protein
MRNLGKRLSVIIAAVTIAFGLVGAADGQRNDRQTRDLVRSLNSQVDNFHYTLENELRSDSGNQDLEEAANGLQDLQESVNAFEDNLNQRRENRDDMNGIVEAARNVDSALARGRQNQRIQRDWEAIKTTIGRLSGNYGITPSWNGRGSTSNYPSSNSPSNYPSRRGTYPTTRTAAPASTSDLTGTYRLNTSRSENTDQILSETNVAGAQRQDLQKKLEAPEQLAIDVRGNQVILASSIASPVSFIADGSEKTDTDAGGRTIHLRATLKGQELTVSSLGGETDYTVIFTPTDGGRSLKVTRRITTDYLQQTVFADSYYERTDTVARLGIDTGDQNTGGGWSSNDTNNNNGSPSIAPGRTGEFIVPNGTIVTGVLENTIDTKASQNNDRFKMTVQSPLEFRGAIIEGYITGVGRSGRVSGSSNVTFNFETITLRDGKTYDFAGFLQSIKDQNGKTVKVDTEGTAKGSSQTKETAKRGGIGAGLGAVIGAIAGGGTGAAVGAIIGGGVGAGSVIVQGRDDVQLMKGSTITIQASSPIRTDQPSDN